MCLLRDRVSCEWDSEKAWCTTHNLEIFLKTVGKSLKEVMQLVMLVEKIDFGEGKQG